MSATNEEHLEVDRLESEIAKLVEDKSRAEFEAKWRKVISKRLRALADQVEAGCLYVEMYTYCEEYGIDSVDASLSFSKSVQSACMTLNDGSGEGDEWGIIVPIQKRVTKVVTL